MLVDADDWVDVRLVEAARTMIGHGRIGALIERGVIANFQTLRVATLPHPHVFEGAFHRICGSSSVARLRPDASEPLHRDPCHVLRSHHEWVERAQEHGAELVRLPVSGGYLINTSENHSEVHGPYAAWRRELAACVNREGYAIDGAIAARFGLSPDQIRAASSRFFSEDAAQRSIAAPVPGSSCELRSKPGPPSNPDRAAPAARASSSGPAGKQRRIDAALRLR
jgi:hypothetical protein